MRLWELSLVFSAWMEPTNERCADSRILSLDPNAVTELTKRSSTCVAGTRSPATLSVHDDARVKVPAAVPNSEMEQMDMKEDTIGSEWV